MIFRFNHFELDSDRFQLWHRGEPVHVEPKVLEFLVFLLENRERLVTKQELLDELWEQEFVGDDVLTRCVYLARRALDDASRQQRFVRTVHGRGYRFNDQIEVEVAASSAALAPEASDFESTGGSATSGHARSMPRRALVFAGVLAIVLLAVGVLLTSWRTSGCRTKAPHDQLLTVAVRPFASQGDPEAEVLAEIMTRELIVHLTRSPRLRVVSLPPSGPTDEPSVRNRLLEARDVRYTIGGHVVLSSGEVNASMTMLDQEDSTVVWSQKLEGAIEQTYEIAARGATSVGYAVGVFLDAHELEFPGRVAFEHYARGVLMLKSFDPQVLDSGIEEARRCLDLAPDFEPAHALVATGLLQYRNLGLDYDPAHIAEAAEHLDRVVGRLPDAVGLQGLRTWVCLSAYDFRGAQQWLDRSLETDPDGVTDLTLPPWIAYGMGDVDRALNELDRGILLHPFDAVIRLNKVVFAVMDGRHEAAEAAFKDFPELYQSELVRAVTHGWLLIGRGEIEQAVEVFSASSERFGFRLLRLAAAEGELARGDASAAIVHLSAWLEANPHALEAHWMLCLSHALLGDRERCRVGAREAERLTVELRGWFDSPALEVYELYFRVVGERPVELERVVAIDPSELDSFSRYLRAVAMARIGDRSAFAGLETPHNPVYWVSRFSGLEIDLLERSAGD